MPSILNLKFKGNKSFVAFSNLNDAESLTQTWKVCTKVASYLEQGQRLENLSWRLWHLQNLIVDTDNAKSRREFKKLSKCMGDKLDKEKGRSIEELSAPDFRRNHSTDMIRQRAAEKERNREANLNSGGTIKRMQFTFSVDQPTHLLASLPVKKPDTKPSAELSKRFRVATRVHHEDILMAEPDTSSVKLAVPEAPPLSITSTVSHQALHFPTLFNDSFGPSALLYASPTLTTTMTYGEGFAPSGSIDDQFRISRPTIEVPLDEILFNDDSAADDSWASALNALTGVTKTHDINISNSGTDLTHHIQKAPESAPAPAGHILSAAGQQQDAIMLPIPPTPASEPTIIQQPSPPLSSQFTSLPAIVTNSPEIHGRFLSQSASSSVEGDDELASLSDDDDEIDQRSPAPSTVKRASIFKTLPPLSAAAKEALPETIAPSRLHSIYGTRSSTPNTTRPTLTLKTQGTMTTRSSGPGASLTSLNPAVLRGNNGNNGPGGVKAECSNCGATHTPLWRRGLNDELNCNACGLYCKLHKRPRPKSMRTASTTIPSNPNTNNENRLQSAPRPEPVDVVGTSRPRSLSTKGSSLTEPQAPRSSVTAQCYNCHTTATPLWRKDDEGKTVCNACGLYYKLHGSARPISMKSDVIRKRSRHDARRSSQSGLDDIPTSPVMSLRTSPGRETSPTLAPDSTTQISYEFAEETSEYRSTTSSSSELVGALGPSSTNNTSDSSTLFSSFSMAYPGPYHPDYIMQLYGLHSDPISNSSSDSNIESDPAMSPRSTKRRRMSTDSATEPPSSAVSFSSYGSSVNGGDKSAHSKKGSMDFAFTNFNSPNAGPALRGSGNTFWHPPMMPQNQTEPENFWHPPLVPPITHISSNCSSSGKELSPVSDSGSTTSSASNPPSISGDSQIDFLQAAMIPDDELFSAYLHSHEEKLGSHENGSGTAMYVDTYF